jgi:predicted transcriptional regulator
MANQIPKVVKIDPLIRDRLEKLSALKHRSIHWLMKEAILYYLAQEEYKEQLKQETLLRWQEAEQNRIVSHEVVIEWLDTWGADEKKSRPPCES